MAAYIERVMLARAITKNAALNVRAFSTIPVKNVATFFKLNVQNEEKAAAFDEFVKKEAIPVTSQTTGWVKW